MSESNGTVRPAGGTYRRAVERHRAERAAWDRVRVARIELAAAVADYELFWQGCPLPPGRPLLGAIAELPDDERDDAAIIAELQPEPVNGLVELPAGLTPAQRAGFAETDVILPTLEDTLAAEADAEADGLPPWTSQDLEDELLHALSSGGLAAELAWGALIRGGGTNDEINQHLGVIWPRARRFTPPSVSGGRKLGHTIVYGTSQPCFWLGKMDGPGHKPTLANSALIDRIRTVLGIPTPTEARKRAQASFSDAAARQGIPVPEPTIAAAAPPARPVKRAVSSGVQSGQDRGIGAPAAGWDDMSLRLAADDLGIALGDLAICDKCDAARARDCHPCPRYGCGGLNYRLTDSPAVWGAPAYQPPVRGKLPVETERPVKRGRGRPPGAKTRKPAAVE